MLICGKEREKVMIWLIILFFCTFLYMEAVYHIACFGFAAVNPLIAVFIWLFLAGFASLLMGFFRRKKIRIILWVLLAIDYLLFASQLVYIKIFKQPLLMAAIKNGGKDAMTNYWKEALVGIFECVGLAASDGSAFCSDGAASAYVYPELKEPHEKGKTAGADGNGSRRAGLYGSADGWFPCGCGIRRRICRIL